ncbi:MAG: bifunctional histidinol-phosphatase/imidazoleglycerol-phosphate dehydratase HisB [Fusobacteriaceae bacterium]
MSKKILFVDRDGTLIVEPPKTFQVNSLEEMTFLPYVISSLKKISDAGFEIIIVTNQDGLGTEKNPRENYEKINSKMFEVFAGEGVKFSNIFECPHFKEENCSCRKPKLGMISDWLKKIEKNSDTNIDKNNSYMIGDRETDIEFGNNLGIKSFLITENFSWQNIADEILKKPRKAEISRKTKETEIFVGINLDGNGKSKINTRIKFLDHMLEQIPKHGNFDLEIFCSGDLQIDEHHSIEDIGIALGEAFKKALENNKNGIERYAFDRLLVMDEAKVEISIDLSGRPYFVFDGNFDREFVGDFPTEMLEHFLHSFFLTALINAHVSISGKNSHHKIECIFKGLAKVLRDAVKKTGTGVISTKGVL